VTRADRISVRLAADELDALLVTDMLNVRYVTGFTGSTALAVVGPEVRRFVTDFRYVEQARAEVDGFEHERAAQALHEVLKDGWGDGPVRLGFDDASLSVQAHAKLRALLPERVELLPAAGVVEAERAIKEPGEVETLGAAAALVDDIYAWVVEHGLAGKTERDVAVAIEHEMRVRGASGPSFPSIVASGAHGALPHAQPRDVEIPRDTLVTIDIGARLDGYCSDCTRTFSTGQPPDDLLAAYALVLTAQVTALDGIRPGIEGREGDALARDIIEAAGHGEHFGHSLGHGVGLQPHEAPRLARTATARLQVGHAVTVEPGVYLPGRGGVRIEDLVVVTEDGRTVLSKTDKQLLTVG
jgi:Xaa-Pro aminopeptidase